MRRGNVIENKHKTPESIFSKEVQEELSRNRTPSTQMLGALQGKALYGGTVTKQTKDRRRAANKTARASRQNNRKR